MPASVYVSFDAPEGGAGHAEAASRCPVGGAGLAAGGQPGEGGAVPNADTLVTRVHN